MIGLGTGVSLKVPHMAGFLPTQLPNLQQWFRADGPITKDGSNAVSQWNDESGNARHLTQGTGVKQPTYSTNIFGTRPGILFDGSSDELEHAYAGTATHTLFVVFRTTVTAALANNYSPFYISTSTRLCQKLGTTNWGTFAGSDFSALEDLTSGESNVLEFTSNPGVLLSLYRNGTLKNTAVATVTGGTAGRVGNEATLSRYVQGYMAEILVYSDLKSVGDRTTIRRYLGSKWGITVV